MKIEKKHIKALFKNEQTRKSMIGRLDDEKVAQTDLDALSSAEFAVLHDAAWETFGDWDVPLVKTHSAQGSDGPYSIRVMGVEGAYLVWAPEFDDGGLFETIEEANGYININWLGEAKED